MKIDVTRAFCIAGQPHAPGTTLDVPDLLARELIHNGKAVPAVEKPAAAPVRASRKDSKD